MGGENEYIELNTELQQFITSEEANHFEIFPKFYSEDKVVFYLDEKKKEEIPQLTDELELIFEKKIEFSIINSKIFRRTLSYYYRVGSEDSHILEIQNEYIDQLIVEAKKINASDIHIETYEKDVRIRIRLDGKLVEYKKLNKDDYAEIINQIKIKAKLDITEKRLPQDGRISYKTFDVRVSIIPGHYGEKVVMRILGKDASRLDIKALGFEEIDLANYIESIKRPNGIILISGPTGSGKTTTLYATLKFINKIDINILTVEDPIEYTLEGINQVQLKEDIGLNFERTLKSFLRQDPDVIMLGEIRDAATANMAIRASLTGHLVLSTIHTNSAIGTISRLIDMGVPRFLIAETLSLSVAQRLIRCLCSDCKEKEILRKQDLPEDYRDKNILEHYIPVGCHKCHYSGYTGRRAIYEFLPISKQLSHTIKNAENIENTDNINIIRLSEQAFKLYKQGETSLEEIYPILLTNTDS